MNKSIIFGIVLALVAFSTLNIVSAYNYGYNGYNRYDDSFEDTHYVKTTYGYDGYSRVERTVESSPWGKTTSYRKVEDYDSRYPYAGNRVYSYWNDGPRSSRVYYNSNRQHLGYAWDDSWRRYVDDSSYHDYYYNSRQYYNGDYWDWRGDCVNVRYCHR